MEFNTLNKHLVTSSGRNAVRIMRITSETVLDRHDALILAAWIVALVDWDDADHADFILAAWIVALVDWDDADHADFQEALALVTAT